MNIIAYDPLIESGQSIGDVEIVSFEDVLKRSHFITVHTPLTPETEGMIGPDQLNSMMPGSIIVNCARGDIIQEPALADALHSWHLAGASLDVVEPAPRVLNGNPPENLINPDVLDLIEHIDPDHYNDMREAITNAHRDP